MQEFDGQGKWGGEDEANGDEEDDDEEDQVWPLAQFNSVGFSQSRIGVRKSVFKNAQSRFASAVFDSVLGPPCLARHT